MGLDTASWWAIARSEEVNAQKPFSADMGDLPIVLWRDRQGIARAMEDRCPHRRAPLSLGCIREDGAIQCGYHGWTFDGATGRLIEIPNMKDKQRFPALYRGRALSVSESGGFVRVILGDHAPIPAIDSAAYSYSGTVDLSCGHQDYIDALHDDPGLVIAIRGIHFGTYLASELHEESGWLVMERNCQWAGPHWPDHFVAEFPLTLLMRTHPVTGETRLVLQDDRFNPLFYAILAPVPAARGVTAVRWRAQHGVRGPGVRGALLRGLNPLTVRSFIDGSKLRRTKPSASIYGGSLRKSLVGAQGPIINEQVTTA